MTLKKTIEPCSQTIKQLHLFSMPNGRGNTLLDYDLIPRFLHDRAQKKVLLSGVASQEPRVINMNDSEKYEIIPATISEKKKNDQGEDIYVSYAVYPGTRESLIEDCLILFARNGEFSIEKGQPGYVYNSGLLGVCFTLHQLRVALKSKGKEYKLEELREGLEVLLMAKYRYTNESDRDRLCGYIVSELDSLRNPSPNDKIRSDRVVHVVFDSRASQRILGGHYRAYDANLALSMKSPIARFLYKQFTQHWQNANLKNEGGCFREIEQNETIKASGCPLLSNITKRKTNLMKALKELSDGRVIQPIDEAADVFLLKESRKIVDLRVVVRPTTQFIKQQIEGYQTLKESRRLGAEREKEVDNSRLRLN